MKILVLGYGMLGYEIVQQTKWDYISRKKNNFDITNKDMFSSFFIESHEGLIFTTKYDCIINCIANTDTYSNDRESHWAINYEAAANLVDFCNNWNIKLVQISTDHVYANSVKNASETDVPVHDKNWYGYTKLASDAYVQLKSKDYLLIRESHKPYPFPYKQAWSDQYTCGDYVNTIASMIISLVKNNASGLFNVGTDLKSWHDLTKQEFNTEKINRPVHTPEDISMDITKIKKYFDNI
jgi:dTDP-4-dehydrorhamnose reductase